MESEPLTACIAVYTRCVFASVYCIVRYGVVLLQARKKRERERRDAFRDLLAELNAPNPDDATAIPVLTARSAWADALSIIKEDERCVQLSLPLFASL